MIAFERVGKRFGSAPAVIEDLSLTVARGEFVRLSGPSSTGKSTVLRMIAALEIPTAGKVRVNDVDVAGLRPRARAALRRTMGIVPQQLLLLPDRSALDNVMLPALSAGLPLKEARARALAALERVGVRETASVPTLLSGSAQQRVALARAIVNRPALLLADEPTANLDDAATEAMTLLLAEFAAAGVTVVIASHREGPTQPAQTRTIRLGQATMS
jgi:cell division transport system ATP-binding protein